MGGLSLPTVPHIFPAGSLGRGREYLRILKDVKVFARR